MPVTTETLVGLQEFSASGGPGVAVNSTRTGYIPIPLARVPAPVFADLPVYLRRTSGATAGNESCGFALYRGAQTDFSDADRNRLLTNGTTFVYVRMSDQTRFRSQLESRLDQIAADPRIAVSARAAIIYETGVELVNELLADPNVAVFSTRLAQVSRAVVTLALDDASAFSHLFATSHHDFYTATHMVNVAAYMVALRYALGCHDPIELGLMSHAGLLHDIGKIYVPEDVLNQPGQLSDDGWALLKRHPELGYAHLRQYEGIDPVVMKVARQHHERLDGSGYPGGVHADEIEYASKICAVADCFDAMTAFRPFKKRTLSVAEALAQVQSEVPHHYDPEIVAALQRLVASATGPAAQTEAELLPAVGEDDPERRGAPRVLYNCPVRLHVLEQDPSAGWREQPARQVTAHNISRSGMGVLSRVPVDVGERVHAYLDARGWNIDYLEAEIVRCRSYRDGWFEIGMHFIAAVPTGGAVKPVDPSQS